MKFDMTKEWCLWAAKLEEESPMKSLKAMKQKLEEVQAEMKKNGEEALKEALKEFFKGHEVVDSITWLQYTPYFNDGDTCEFGVHDPELKFKEGIEATKYVSQSAIDTANKYYKGDLHEINAWSLKDDTKLKADFKEFAGYICGMKDLMKNVFGDHVKVTCYADRVEVEEYQHD